MNIKFTVREIVFIVLLGAMPIGTWLFIFKPHNAINAQMCAEIEAKQAKLHDLNYATATLGDLKKEIASLETAIHFFESKLPSEKEIDKVLRDIWRLAEQSRLMAKSIRTMERTNDRIFIADESAHAEQPISMKLQGDFLGLYSFLLSLESQPRIMRVRQMHIKKPSDAPEGFMEAEMVMSVFFEQDRG